jgi:hypothetical protein
LIEISGQVDFAVDPSSSWLEIKSDVPDVGEKIFVFAVPGSAIDHQRVRCKLGGNIN